METTTDTKTTITLLDISYKTLFFHIITTISYTFSPVMNKNLHAVLVKICTSRGDPLSLSALLKCTTLCLHCAHIHCLVSINIQQESMNVNGGNFLCMEQFSDTPLLHMYFHIRHHFVRLSLCCHLSHSSKM